MSKFWRHFISDGNSDTCGSYLGLQGLRVPISVGIARQLPTFQRNGVRVLVIQPCSPAERTGILEGDIILALDRRPVESMDELEELLLELPPKMPVSVIFSRRQHLVERMVVLQPGATPAIALD